MASKTQAQRVRECVDLRKKWVEAVGVAMPHEVVLKMNAFVSDGAAASGTIPFYDKHLEYQFAARPGRETFVRIFSRDT